MSTAPAPNCPIDARAASLARQYSAKGDLELLFVRQIAAAEVTFHSLQRTLDKLYAADELDDVRIDRLTRAQTRAQRMQTIALKELKDLQARRNIAERFPEQTKNRPPLGDHLCYVGDNPLVRPLSPPQPRATSPNLTLAPNLTANFTQHNPFNAPASEARR